MRKEAYEIGSKSKNPMIVFVALVLNHHDFNNRRPLTVKGLAATMGVRNQQIERWCENLHIVLKRKGKDLVLMTEQQALEDA